VLYTLLNRSSAHLPKTVTTAWATSLSGNVASEAWICFETWRYADDETNERGLERFAVIVADSGKSGTVYPRY
jgi:hypothetical protein